MPSRNLEFLFALLTTTAQAAGVDFFQVPAASSPPRPTAPQPAPTIQTQVLDPLQVVHVPVAVDRLTTIRFPSPVSDLVSALVATEPHPQALFILTFQPGESFFSLQALRTNVSTSLNVVWHSQTYVFELHASPTPVLSLILTNRPAPRMPAPIPRPAPMTNTVADNPWLPFESVARQEPSLRRLFPRGMQNFQRYPLHHSDETVLSGLRLEDILIFRDEQVAVVRVTFGNRTPARLEGSSLGVELASGGKPVRVLNLARPEAIGPYESHALFATINWDPTANPEAFARALRVRHPLPSGGTKSTAPNRP